MTFIDWYKKNKKYIHSALIASAVLGIVAACAVAFFPSLLLGLAAFTAFGSLPFAFLTQLHLALSLPILGVGIACSFAFIATAVLAIARQIGLISHHVLALFTKEIAVVAPYSKTESYEYLAEHLQKKGLDFNDADEDDCNHFIEPEEMSTAANQLFLPALPKINAPGIEPALGGQLGL